MLHPGNMSSSYIFLQTIPNGQTVNQCQTNRLISQFQSQQQVIPLAINSASCNVQHETSHTNTNQRQYYRHYHANTWWLQICYSPHQWVIQLFLQHQYQPQLREIVTTVVVSMIRMYKYDHKFQTTRIFSSSKTPNKCLHGANTSRGNQVERINGEQQQNVSVFPNQDELRNETATHTDQYQPSLTPCRYATTRFPFSPFTLILHKMFEINLSSMI